MTIRSSDIVSDSTPCGTPGHFVWPPISTRTPATGHSVSAANTESAGLLVLDARHRAAEAA
jgi:hypothetical protein